MKRLAAIFFVFLCVLSVRAQTDRDRSAWAASLFEETAQPTVEKKNHLIKFDFGPLWTRVHDNASVLGYIGDNFQRMRIVILTANRNSKQPDTYSVTGKSMVKNVVRTFNGTMKVTKASSLSATILDEEYKGEKVKDAGVIVGEYHFSENSKQTGTGSFDGVFATYWLIDRNGRLQYDEVMVGADGWRNNQFAGTWTSYRTKASKPASWGDSRIPVAGDLDIGAGEFSPEEKYVANGWQSYHDAYVGQNKRALAEERRQWWR